MEKGMITDSKALEAENEQNALMPLDDVAAAELRRLHAQVAQDEALLREALHALEYASDMTKPDDLQGCDCTICISIAALRERLNKNTPPSTTSERLRHAPTLAKAAVMARHYKTRLNQMGRYL